MVFAPPVSPSVKWSDEGASVRQPALRSAMDLRGQKVDTILKPTTSVYAPFYLSSRGYAVFVQGNWPGYFDFCNADPQRVKIEFEGPFLSVKVYTAKTPVELVKAHALDAGPPILPPRWTFTPWRWRDEHTHRATYYDGTPVTGPFNSEIMEDVLMMKAFGIPNGIYWIDRPWGPGKPWGYDDFEIDEKRLPNFAEMVRWLDGQQSKTVLWIAPFFQGEMMKVALAKGYNLPGQVRPLTGNERERLDTDGRLVVEEAQGPAAIAGVERGDVILAVNDRRVASIGEFRSAVSASGATVALLIQRNGAEIFIPVRTDS